MTGYRRIFEVEYSKEAEEIFFSFFSEEEKEEENPHSPKNREKKPTPTT